MKTAKIAAFLVLVLGLAIGLVSTAQAQPKYVIFLIGDGMGFEHVKAAGMYANGQAGTLSFESFPYNGQLTTYAANAAVPDSAAAGTALATGVKVNTGVISMAYPGDGSELETLLEYFKARGKSTGLVTTSLWFDATPAAFGAHEPSRYNYEGIAIDYLYQTRPNVVLGGFYNEGIGAVTESAGYTVVTDRAAMQALDTETETMVFGQFGDDNLPYEYDGLGSLPHLSEMTTTALSILDNDPDGFFLMVEGGCIDHACHSNDLQRAVPETVEFDNTVQVAIDWAAGRTDTLILVTADHETGGLTVLANNGVGVLPTVQWSTVGHTSANMPVYAWGVNAEMISGVMDNTDMFGVVTAGPQARNPDPADGALHPDASANLSWAPGISAVSHDVYFGDNFNDVNSGTGGTFQGNQTETSFTVGLAGFAYPNGLAADTTYYWRVDEVNDLDPNSPWVGSVWSFTTAPSTAYEPNPTDGSEFVDLNVGLSWTPGLGAVTHDVYLGDNFADVNDGTGETLKGTVTEPSYTPGTLAGGTVYYWRIDESDGVATYKGEVWSFKTLTPPPPEWTCLDIATTGGSTSYESTTGTWTIIADGTDIWGNNDQFRFCYQKPTRGDCTLIARVVSFPVPANGDNWQKAGLMIRETLEPGSKNAFVAISGGSGNGATFQWRTDTNGISGSSRTLVVPPPPASVKLVREGDTFTGYVLLDGQWQQEGESATIVMGDEVHIGLAVTSHKEGLLTTAVIANVSITTADLNIAWSPSPADGATNVPTRGTILSWMPGDNTASVDGHELYFSSDVNAVNDRTADKVVLSDPSYTITTKLDLGKTYYWCVDEVDADGTTKYKGNVWSFTTATVGR